MFAFFVYFQEKLKDTKVVIRGRKSQKTKPRPNEIGKKDKQCAKKLKIDQREPHYKPGVNAGVPERYAVSASHCHPSKSAITKFASSDVVTVSQIAQCI